jgi:NADPH2:quinone reductase
VQAYGAASAPRHALLRSLGATAIEGRAVRIDRALREVLPGGVDFALDGLGGRFVRQCIQATRRGGSVVGYGFSGATDAAGRPSTLQQMRGMIALYLGAPLAARRGRFYGITLLYRKDPRAFHEDLPKLFDLLGRGVIRPKIAARLPLLAARRAGELLERGGLEGKIVHLATQSA